ncbi:SRPBCC family protein [Algiphilus sp.]|uniref:SRPBCC family protein n=1 Tax=Algiphilus sp. TaxID=1872431 RepID=UPI0025BC5301|nr:SRPBCC family protein [Algiphilus sp.]
MEAGFRCHRGHARCLRGVPRGRRAAGKVRPRRAGRVDWRIAPSRPPDGRWRSAQATGAKPLRPVAGTGRRAFRCSRPRRAHPTSQESENIVQELQIVENVGLSPDEMFSRLADHENLGKVLGVPVKRTRDGEGDVNGRASVRTLGLWPLDFDETITAFEPPGRIAYAITRGSPLRNHQAVILLSPSGGGTEVRWVISFNCVIPLTGGLIRRLMRVALTQGIRKLARTP